MSKKQERQIKKLHEFFGTDPKVIQERRDYFSRPRIAVTVNSKKSSEKKK